MNKTKRKQTFEIDITTNDEQEFISSLKSLIETREAYLNAVEQQCRHIQDDDKPWSEGL
jgi:hypothetical protein